MHLDLNNSQDPFNLLQICPCMCNVCKDRLLQQSQPDLVLAAVLAVALQQLHYKFMTADDQKVFTTNAASLRIQAWR